MGWNKLLGFVRSLPSTATLADIDWRGVLNQVWELALLEGGGGRLEPDAPWSLEMWQSIVHSIHADTIQGLRNYMWCWEQEDTLVGKWTRAIEPVPKPTADLGGWLADYTNTQFLIMTGQVRTTVKYRVVDNRSYHSLCQLLGPAASNPVKAGNVWEQLCWRAFEKERGAFVLAVIWNTTNRCLLPPPTSWEEASIATSGGASQPAVAAGPGGSQERTKPAPTIAGAPQPSAAAGPDVSGTPCQQPGQARQRQQPGMSSSSSIPAPLLMSLDLAGCRAIQNRKIQCAYQRIREELNHVSGTTPPPAVDAGGWPLRVALSHPDVWKHWVASLGNVSQIVGLGIRDAYWQFRSHEDPNRVVYSAALGCDVCQRRLDLIIERVDGSVVVLHPTKNKVHSHFYDRGEFEA